MQRLLLLLCLCSVGAYSADYASLPALPSGLIQEARLLDMERAGERLVAVGERGLIAYSDDEGASWKQARVPSSETLTAVSFPTAEHGWAVGHGGVILHSGDAGSSWQLQFDGNDANRQKLDYVTDMVMTLEQALEQAPAETVADLEYELEEAQFAVEDAELAVATGPADPFLDVWFANAEQGLAVGAYGMIYSTDNGGLQWRLAMAGIENLEGYHYYSLAASDTGQLYLSGEAGLLYRSDDGGEVWQRLPLDYDGSLFGVLVAVDGTVVTFGLRGNIFYSTDSGNSWSEAALPDAPGLSFYGGKRLPDGKLVLVGTGGVMASSSDQGLSFVADIQSSRSTFSSVEAIGDDLLLGGVDGLVHITAARRQRP
ncbi:MAG: YCF48-related protein [Halieaceae bacterium]